MGLGAISTGQGQMTAAQVRDALQTLGGTDRLDASAIKNLPGGNGGVITTYTYVADGDANGLLFGITPANYVIQSSPPFNGTFPAAQAVDRTTSSYISVNAPGSFWSITLLGSTTFKPNRYSIRNRADASANLLLNWQIQGSTDGVTWSTLDAQTNNSFAVGGWFTQAISTSTFFRHIRCLSTGIDSSGNNLLAIGEIEFYGSYST